MENCYVRRVFVEFLNEIRFPVFRIEEENGPHEGFAVKVDSLADSRRMARLKTRHVKFNRSGVLFSFVFCGDASRLDRFHQRVDDLLLFSLGRLRFSLIPLFEFLCNI